MSEVARLRKQIELECEAMKQALYGYAVVASHDAIITNILIWADIRKS